VGNLCLFLFFNREESKDEVNRELENHYLHIFSETGDVIAIPEEVGRKVLVKW
jgi:hypothetical protein